MLQKENLEKLLIKNWTQFIDIQNFMSFVVSLVKDRDFPKGESDINYKRNGTQIKLSQFSFNDKGFLVWVEFVFPKKSETAVGTIELTIDYTGKFEVLQVQGISFKNT